MGFGTIVIIDIIIVVLDAAMNHRHYKRTGEWNYGMTPDSPAVGVKFGFKDVLYLLTAFSILIVLQYVLYSLFWV